MPGRLDFKRTWPSRCSRGCRFGKDVIRYLPLAAETRPTWAPDRLSIWPVEGGLALEAFLGRPLDLPPCLEEESFRGSRCRLALLNCPARQRHIRLVPEGEREEVRQIFAAKGLHGEDVERFVDVITSDPELWTETMMSEELGFGSTEPNEYRAAGALLTAVAFLVVGGLKSRFVDQAWWRSALETLAVGGGRGAGVRRGRAAEGVA